MQADIINKYFPDLTPLQKEQFSKLQELYTSWNEKINVISRKDIDALYVRHVLHSLGIAKVMSFEPGTKVLDVGTDGGFPGIPLAILFPDVQFHLVDSIGKKIKVVKAVSEALGLENVEADQMRAEQLKSQYHFVVSRAVTRLKPFYQWVKNKFLKDDFNQLPNGILYLKGGDLKEELTESKKRYKLYNLPDFFEEPFFETKKVVYVPKS
ncbi:16S rRNA (guanine(527)-N(7))-methyltransferase RsmG [Fulvivirga sp. RKSG066]|uniref:16S rRNA (guanine(527)-N(7))-methyltransferase RsmG n=1 Tax=Fulvivirga aurantia TaxID=2529383 RepID=UPI0012BB9EAC|nr:16S rRNA (guanine(527)-N(7))-methyltransferase RsmG [Fulvivirga aurantia]MTI20593.1 16S rRNA (guanine(527)-N(7))-methyltransferase RsmG [Fulvivirga aurantia]